MSNVIVYSTQNCPYCVSAKELLTRKNISFEEVRVDENPDELAKMMKLSGRRTVPQIFIDDKPIGGFDDLAALNDSGELDNLIK